MRNNKDYLDRKKNEQLENNNQFNDKVYKNTQKLVAKSIFYGCDLKTLQKIMNTIIHNYRKELGRK